MYRYEYKCKYRHVCVHMYEYVYVLYNICKINTHPSGTGKLSRPLPTPRRLLSTVATFPLGRASAPKRHTVAEKRLINHLDLYVGNPTRHSEIEGNYYRYLEV